MLKKKLITMVTALTLVVAMAIPTFAVTIDDIEVQRSATQQKLSEVQSYIRDLEVQKEAVLGQIDTIDAELVTSIAAINTLDGQIKTKQKEIKKTKKKLKKAKVKKENCYNAMKKRIQYIYENGGENGWMMAILSKKSVAQAINQASFTQQLYEYDRKCLDEYTEAINKVKKLKKEQETQKSEFETMKSEQEAEKASLEVLLAQAKEASDNYDAEIANANAIAGQYQNLIAEQNRAIQELVEAQARAEEEARQEALRQAELQAAEEAEAQAQEETQYEEAENYNENNYDESSQEASQENYSEYQEEASYQESYNDESYVSESNTETDDYDYDNEAEYEPAETYEEEYVEPQTTQTASKSSSSATSGQAIVDYAMQFVGNPYVWGGNSLTDGVDCSGFVNQVYKHFGYDVARQSAELRSSGTAVSYADAQPGDIICYSGHVGIYMGDGQIVHASDPTRGIISGTDASYHDILAVRRVV